MNYWLHRISHNAEVSYPLLDQNILSIGFSDFSYKEFIKDILTGKTTVKQWELFESKVDETWGERLRTRYNLWRFIAEFKKGDRVLVPSWGTFSIYELVSELPEPISRVNIDQLKDWHGNALTFKNNLIHNGVNEINLGFYWEVKLIAQEISRKDFANAALTSRMKIRSTNANINDLKESVEGAIEAFRKNAPINLYSNILGKITNEVLSSLKSDLNPDKFEHLVKFYFERNGATETYIPSKNEKDKEGDADVVAIFEPIKTIIYAQVKFHDTDSETNEWAVKQIKSYKENKEAMDDGYTKIAWVISSAESFTKDCIKMAQQEQVSLIDGTRFAEMLIEAGILGLNKGL